MSTLAQDLRYALRRLRRSPGFTVLVALILALGIGANTAIFSAVNATLLRRLPFRDPGHLLALWETESASGRFPLTGQDFLDWRSENRTFEGLSVYSYSHAFNASGEGQPERVEVVETQANFFRLLGVRPVVGRTFQDGEDAAGRNRVALLSHGLWQTRFGGRRDVVGDRLVLNSETYTIVGVMPSWYRTPGSAQLWIPIDMSPESLGPRGEHHLRALGRVKAGVSLAAAEGELRAIAARLEREFPDTNAKVGVVTAPLKDALVSRARRELLVLLGAVTLVLLIACANVANLLLARATGRRREFAVRAAIGAGRRALVRQLLIESVLLALLGGVLGGVLAWAMVSVLASAETLPVPAPNPIRVDPVVLLFTLAVSLVVGVLFGLAPALQASRPDLSGELRSAGNRSMTGSGRSRLLREGLVAVEIALCLMLLTGAGLMLRTFANLRRAEVGVRAEGVLAATVTLPALTNGHADARWGFCARLLQSFDGAPGVRRVALTSELPLEGGSNGYITIDGQPAESTQDTLVEWTYVTPAYFQTMGIPLAQGREFDEADLAAAAEDASRGGSTAGADDSAPRRARVAVVSRTMARRFWPSQSAVNSTFRVDKAAVRVIGVVGDVKIWDLRTPPIPQAYFPFPGVVGYPGSLGFDVVARSASAPEDVAGVLREKVQALDRTLAVSRLRTVDQIATESMTGTTYQTTLLAAFAGLAVLLATLGIYGVMSYAVSQRTAEFGVRLALGAQPSRVSGMVVLQGARLALVGTLAGLFGALAFAGVLRSLLFGVEPIDVATLAAAGVMTLGVCLLACWLPARRAAAVDPLVALRYE
jgi:putative ABC transport system permease protein